MLHTLFWLYCHTSLCNNEWTSNQDIRTKFVETNPKYDQFKLSGNIGHLLGIIYYGQLKKQYKAGGVRYNVRLHDQPAREIKIIEK